MESRLATLIQSFQKAHHQLLKALAQPKDEFVRDSAIQRFEFTFELFWKVLRQYAAREGIEVNSPRASIREAFRLKIIGSDPQYLEMLESRNLSAHTYEEELAEELFSLLPAYARAMQEAVEAVVKACQAEVDNTEVKD
jgi:nucleotidyltransferase substrate binding protein (TIGR01987 family)